MSILGFITICIVAALCGSLGAAIAGHSSRGCLTNVVLGLAGALVGTWLSHILHIRDFFYIRGIPIIWSIIGSALFVALVNGMMGGGRKRRRK